MSNRDEFWALKIVALLHDPPGKALDIQVHERDARRLLEVALGRAPTTDEWRRAKDEADLIASAFDRANFPKFKDETVTPKEYLTHSFPVQPMLVHPLGGEWLNLGSLQFDQQAATQAVENVINDLILAAGGGTDSLRRRYLLLWRCLLPMLEVRNGGIGPLWALLPAETRMPDHSIWAHQNATAAVASALPEAAFLVFTFGPVQEFISAARRTQDLWAGSFLLSYLSWTAMRPIVDEYGPDCILYPGLWGQPLVDLWLRREVGLTTVAEPAPSDRLRATLPNRFVALLPRAAAERCAQTAALELDKAWRAAAKDVRVSLETLLGGDPGWGAIWERQLATHWETYWSVYAWPPQPPVPLRTDKLEPWKAWLQEAIDRYKALAQPPPAWEFENRVSVFQRATRNAPDPTRPRWGTNIGTAYGILHHLAQKGVEARKSLRDFDNMHGGVSIAERGEKDTLEGRREVLHRPGQDSRREVIQFWGEIASALRMGMLRGEKRYTDVRGQGRERLSAVGAVKRFAFREHFEHLLDVRVPAGATPLTRFPSTSSIAAAPFKARLLEHLMNMPASDPVAEALREHLRCLNRLDIPATAGEHVLPGLAERVEALRSSGSPNTGIAAAFLEYDGDLLFPEIYNKERLADDYNRPGLSENDIQRASEALRALLYQANRATLGRPTTYFAVLMFDVDRMGEWLSGEHPDSPTLGELVVPDVADVLRNPATWDWDEVLSQRRPLGPALHAAISQTLADFSRELVPHVIEQRYLGRVIYAGGDDCLALLPTETALAAARLLRVLVSGHVSWKDGLLQPDFSHNQGYIEWPRGKWLLVPGPEMTASAGIAIAHHQAPLDGLLAAAREAEGAAKDTYDRNAVCVYALKRSGEALRLGSHWQYDKAPDPIGKFGEFRALLREDRLSSKLAYEASAEARALVGLPDAHRSALKRLLKRHKGTQFSECDIEAWALHLSEWSQALDIHRGQWAQEWRRRNEREPDPVDEDFAPQPGPVELGKWLLLARFLETGGAE